MKVERFVRTLKTEFLLKTIGEPISVQKCICRQAEDLIGYSCKKMDLRESCFAFRTAAKTYINKGLGREITKEEALIILRKAEEDGLVLQSGNSQRPMCICTCCGCCCQILTNQKKLSEPAQFFATNFYASVDEDLCVGCGICEDRCNIDAINIEDSIAHVNKARLLGVVFVFLLILLRLFAFLKKKWKLSLQKIPLLLIWQ